MSLKDLIGLLTDSIEFLKDLIGFLKDRIDFLKESIDFLKDLIDRFKDLVDFLKESVFSRTMPDPHPPTYACRLNWLLPGSANTKKTQKTKTTKRKIHMGGK